MIEVVFFSSLYKNPSKRLPFENATLAKRAVETLNLFCRDNISFSISDFEAPIIFTGLAALSVETLKKCFGGRIEHNSSSLIAP